MSVLNDTAEYALRATLYVAQHATEDTPMRADDVAAALGVPRNYLSKILHTLARAGVLASTRGPAGGFWLAIPPQNLSLIRIIDLFDTMLPRRTCVLGRPTCSDRNPCPAHSRWKSISERVATFFRETTVADLLDSPGSLK